jgi:hypothetical protein
MAIVSKATLKTYFQDGKEPDENKYIDLVDTLWEEGGGGVTDHGDLTGLADDDHPQYLLADGSRIVSGDLTIGVGTGNPYLIIDGGALFWRGIQLHTAGKRRWGIEETAHAESGGNAGSDFKIARFNDAGEYVDDSFYIYRNTGNISIVKELNVVGDIIVGDGAGSRNLFIDGAVSAWRTLSFQTGGVTRWILRANTAAESGSNVGSDLELTGRADDGTWINTPLKIIRSTGDIIVSKNLAVSGTLVVGDGSGYRSMGVKGSPASTSDLVWYSGDNLAAIFRRDANDDIVWQRYNPAGTFVATSLIFDSSTGDIHTVPWTDFSTTAITGWASYTTKHLRYKKVGSLVFVTFFIEGTSNSTSTHFTLPFRNNGLVHVSVPGQTRNSGFFDLGVTEVSSDSKTAVCYKLIGGGTWTASGIKRVAGQFFYHTNE